MTSIIRATRETLSNPYSYLGSMAVGSLTFLARDARLGYLVPFLVPFVVQAFARYLAARERERPPAGSTPMHANRKPNDA